MRKKDRDFLLDLLKTPSPTGFEFNGQRCWAAFASSFADSVDNDAYGNTWATRKGKRGAPTVMLEAHADEIGYMVKYISDEGFLRLDIIGGSDTATARGRKLDILGDNGPVRGLIGNTAIHIREDRANEKAPKITDLYVDIGASSKEEVTAAGIRVGHPAVYADEPELLGNNRIVGRALDNRIGGFIIARVLAELSKDAASKKHAATVYAVNAVQEEIGGFGAKMVSHRLEPDVAVVLDVTHATDTPGINKGRNGSVSLAGGPTLTHGSANHPHVVTRLEEVATKAKIKIQHEASSRYTGTDTDTIFQVRSGIPSALVSLPMRYMHSAIETVHLDDVNQCIQLLADFVRSLTKDDHFGWKL